MSDQEDTLDEKPRHMGARKVLNRRKSVADEAMFTQQYIKDNVEKLTELWDEVHMSEENRVARLSTAYDHIRKLVDDMVLAEQCMVDTVKSEITEGLENVKKMRRELHKEEWEPKHEFPSIALLRAIEKEVQELHKVYDTFLREQNELIARLNVLHFRLGISTSEEPIKGTTSLLPSCEKSRLIDTVVNLEEELAVRQEEAVNYQNNIRTWCKNLGRHYGPDDDPTLNVLVNENVSDDGFALNDSVLGKIRELWHEVSAMHSTWLERMELEWIAQYQTIEELWDKCHVNVQERHFSPLFNPANCSQSDLDEMTKETQRLEEVYAIRKPVYTMLAEWKAVWKQKLDMEEKKKDVNYYQSRERGHSLMKDAQLERQINEVLLPRHKKNLTSAYATFKEKFPGETILVEGYEPLHFIEWTENEYKLARESERTAKKKMMEANNSPAKNLKSFMRTPASTSRIPAKVPRLNRVDSNLSVINPIRTIENGPVTSSPKDSPSCPATPLRTMSPMARRN